MNKKTSKIKMNYVPIELEDQLRKDILESIARSYEDTHPLSYLLLDLQYQLNKYTNGYTLIKKIN